MGDERGALEEVADKTSQIVVAGVNETWPNRKLLLAVLPPTMALLIAVLGLWQSARADRAAAAEAERDRLQAAAEVEATRQLEAEKERAIAEREQRIREAELVLPRYTDLVEAVRVTRDQVHSCLDELAVLLRLFDGVQELPDGTFTPRDTQPEPIAPIVDPALLFEVEVPADIVTSCRAIGPTIGPLRIALDKALLVSNPALAAAAGGLTTQLELVDTQGKAVLDRIDPVTNRITVSNFGPNDIGTYFQDGNSTAASLNDLNTALAGIEPKSQQVIDSVRVVVLEVD